MPAVAVLYNVGFGIKYSVNNSYKCQYIILRYEYVFTVERQLAGLRICEAMALSIVR